MNMHYKYNESDNDNELIQNLGKFENLIGLKLKNYSYGNIEYSYEGDLYEFFDVKIYEHDDKFINILN